MGKEPAWHPIGLETEGASIPKKIWMFWYQGWDQVPEIVGACLKTWRRHNPDWTIHTLSASNLFEFLAKDDLAVLGGKAVDITVVSDLIRLTLLRRYGGVWADATLYCLKPLNDWIFSVTRDGGFFAFDKPGPDRMLSNWFIAATLDSYVIRCWLDSSNRYWRIHADKDNYFWHHREFKNCYLEDERFRAFWDSVPKISADGPHYYLPYDPLLFQPVKQMDRRLVETASVPMLKLTHKLRQGPYPIGSVLRYLCDRMNGVPDDSSRS